jgi:MFS transporter, SP family, arabinose:H+ symporter
MQSNIVSTEPASASGYKTSWYIWTLSLIVGFGGFLFGIDTAVVSGAIGMIAKQFVLGVDMEGWVVSSTVLGCVAGTVGSGWMADRFGRVPALRLAGILFFVSTLGSALVTSAAQLVAMRIMGGLGIGIASVVGPLYIAEICPPQVRGRMISLYQLAITVGILAAFASNAVILRWGESITAGHSVLHWMFVSEPWRGMLGACAIPSALFLGMVLFIPESPRWMFLKRGNTDRALSVLKRLLGEEEAAHEVAAIRASVAEGANQASWGELFSPRLRKRLMIGVCMTIFGNLSGINVIMYYAPKLLAASGSDAQAALDGAVMIGVANIVFTFVAVALVDRLGRRPLLLIGVSGCAIGLLSAAFFFSKGGMVLLLPLLLHVACFAFSYGSIGWIVTSELFPNRIRARAAGFVTMFGWGTGFLISQSLPRLLDSLGGTGVFAFYGSATAVAVAYIWWVIPETKGRTLEEIEGMFTKDPAKKSTAACECTSPLQ